MMEMLIPLVGMILLLILGIALLQGKGAWLIAGYNTLSDEEKAKYDEKALCKATGKMMFGITFSMAFIFLGELFQVEGFVITGVVLMIAIILVGIIYINTGNRYLKKEE